MNKPETVWVSYAMHDTTVFKPLTTDDIRKKGDEYVFDFYKKYKSGVTFLESDFPKTFYHKYYDTKLKRLPHFFDADGLLCVSAQCAEVLQQFDLGTGGLVPVKIFQNDQVTQFGGEYFILNFGCHKEVLLPEQSTSLQRNPYDPSADIWALHYDIKDGDIAISSSALAGPDLWFDPKVFHAFFISDRLATALEGAKVATNFKLLSCRVISDAIPTKEMN